MLWVPMSFTPTILDLVSFCCFSTIVHGDAIKSPFGNYVEYVAEHLSDQLMVNGVVWGPVVWDSNRGIPKNPNPAFIFTDPKYPHHQPKPPIYH